MERTRTKTFVGRDQSVRLVRRFVSAQLAGHPCLDDAVLIADEFAANAVQHSGAPEFKIELHISSERVRVIAVSDSLTETVPHVEARMADGEEEDGRGLMIVQALAKEWGFDPDHGRTTVWANLGLVSAP